MSPLRCTVLACLAAMAPALTPTPVLRAPLGRGQRSRQVFAQLAGWTSHVDEESGLAYYCDAQTGECQWEPPQAAAAQQQGYGAQVTWRLVPTTGVCNVAFNVGNDQQQVLGRSHMTEQSLYVSRKQCIVQVAPDGTATLVSIGKPLTLYRAHNDAPWCGIRKSKPLGDDIGYDDGGTHVLADGEQISLDMREPEAAVFTILCQQEERREESADVGGGYGSQYFSDDGNWMWNGAEWVPAR